MATALITHKDCLGHENLPGHPERPERLEAILARLEAPEFSELRRFEAPLGTDELVLLAHPKAYLDSIKASAPARGLVSLDQDTQMNPGSLAAAMRGVGSIALAVDLVCGGDVRNAFSAVRPPGHHAERQRAMGFCLFGNAVIGARHAMTSHGVGKVAIVDFDVHHGNGTQDLVWDDERVLFASIHQMPLYPGTGHSSEIGASGNILNIPFAPGLDGRSLINALETRILPAIRRHRPDLFIISAGFDAHREDPLANLNFAEDDFAEATRQLCSVADELCNGRVVSTLEGGYDLDALAESVAAHVSALMENGK